MITKKYNLFAVFFSIYFCFTTINPNFYFHYLFLFLFISQMKIEIND